MTKQLSLLVEALPKDLRETLEEAHALILEWHPVGSAPDEHLARLQLLIAECDRHRPLEPNGEHVRHTGTCGCEGYEEDPMEPIKAYFFEGEISLVEAYRMYKYSQGESFVYPPDVETLKKFHAEHFQVGDD